ncbi:MAG: DUF2971 domain-containing protein [Nitrososphaerales archaeon]
MDRFEIDVPGPQPEDTPPTLYKYRFFDPDGYHLGVIENAKLWFTSAREFNDPFDSSLQYRFDDAPKGIRLKWAMHFLKREFPHLNHKQRRQLALQRLREIGKDPAYYESFRNSYVERNYDKFGICCLTPVRDDLLMWAHYSDSHRGFCLGIDTSKLFDLQHSLASDGHLIDLQQVTYSEEMPEINFFVSMISKYWHKDIIRLLCTKSTHWSHEREFRLIYWDRVNTALSVGHDAISEVIMGCQVEDKDRNSVLSILNDRQCPAKVYQAHKDQTKFGLRFEKIR